MLMLLKCPILFSKCGSQFYTLTSNTQHSTCVEYWPQTNKGDVISVHLTKNLLKIIPDLQIQVCTSYLIKFRGTSVFCLPLFVLRFTVTPISAKFYLFIRAIKSLKTILSSCSTNVCLNNTGCNDAFNLLDFFL